MSFIYKMILISSDFFSCYWHNMSKKIAWVIIYFYVNDNLHL